MRDDQDLLDEVNRSGFPFQLGVARLVANNSSIAWSVRYAEHRWTNPETSSQGFIDLVLNNQGGVLHLVVECKRPQATEWIFLKEASHSETTRTKAYTAETKGDRKLAGWNDL
jgi:hypothetical protein